MQYCCKQVMSQSVACALEVVSRDTTSETRIFIRHVNKFFDCLNGKGCVQAIKKRNPNIAEYIYKETSDERFKVCQTINRYGY